MKNSVIFDIDGTLANLTHRRVYVASKPKNWKAFEKNMDKDGLIYPVHEVLTAMSYTGYYILLCSGRGEQNREVTQQWLHLKNIPYHELYMRKAGDFRQDTIVKEELYDRILEDGYDPKIVFDDRQQVVDMWRRRGLICAQVAPGNF